MNRINADQITERIIHDGNKDKIPAAHLVHCHQDVGEAETDIDDGENDDDNNRDDAE